MKVNLKENSYEIIIGHNNITKLPVYLNKIISTNKKNIAVFIISHPNIFKLYGNKVISALKNQGFNDVGIGLFPAGENNKSFEQYKKILSELVYFDAGKKKNIIIINLGGGVVGDMGGFIASTYRRGILYIQIPTTLLACVDSSIGGKTGIDFKLKDKIIKNFIGHFHQPSLVFMDLSFLKSLPKKEILNGIAEIIKCGIIKDKSLFKYISNNMKQIINLSQKEIIHVVNKAANIKRIIVQKDERETKGIRTILNYGHTIGHAVEGVFKFKYSHGQAISIGMVVEAKISKTLGILKKEELIKIIDIINKAGLPIKAEKENIGKIVELMKYDKKFKEGKNKFVLPVKIGSVTVKENIPEKIIKESLLI